MRAKPEIKLWFAAVAVLVLFAIFLGQVLASDMTTGHTFSNGETVTADSMNAIANSATINTAFYTAKSSQSTAADADVLLLYSPSLGGFRQMIVANLLYTNSELVNVLFYHPPASQVSNFLFSATWNETSNLLALTTAPVFSNLLALATAPAESNLLALTTSATLSNLLAITTQGTLSNLLRSANDGTKSNFYAGFWGRTNAPPATTAQIYAPTNAGAFAPYYDTTNNQWAALRPPVRFTSSLFSLATAYSNSIPHGLPGTPQLVRWVLNCQTAENGYLIGDEIDVGSVGAYNGTVNAQAFSGGASSTNVFLYGYNYGAGYYYEIKPDGTNPQITNSRWKLKCYATYFP